MMALRLWACALLVFVAACGDTVNRERVIERDSAGIRIIENADHDWPPELAWRIEAEPSLRIGVTDGAPEYQLFRVQSALRLEDGTVVVANAGSGEMRFYDANGAHIRSVGRTGTGPGEFRIVYRIARRGRDSLIAWDPALRRISVFSRDGNFGRMLSAPAFGAQFFLFRDEFDDGSILGHIDDGVQPDAMPDGWHPAISLWFRFHLTGQLDSLARLQSGEFYISRRDDAPALVPPPFSRRSVAAALGENAVLGTSHAWELLTFDRSGRLVRIIRVARANRTLSDAEADSAINNPVARATTPEQRRRRAERYAGIRFPETMPAYSAIEADRDGNLWVAHYQAGPDDPFRWSVFDGLGRLLGSLDMPPGLTVYEIGPDYVLALARNAMDVEQVVVHRLVKPGAG